MKNVDYYKVLEVRIGDDKAVITSSYRRLCKLYHPDVNHDPGAEDLMKEINNAYYILCDEARREAYNSAYFSIGAKARPAANRTRDRDLEKERARAVMKDYFDALRLNAFEMAYELLSENDKRYVTPASFQKWRETVSRLFLIRKYEIKTQPAPTFLTLDGGGRVPAWKHEIEICEKNLMTKEIVTYRAEKYTVVEPGGWKIFLGYRDINEIAKMFERLSRDQERGEMLKYWQEYCSERCREFDMLNLKGFLKESAKEIYRAGRYGQELTVACFKLYSEKKGGLAADVTERAAGIIKAALRETDVPAYLGGGAFAVLYVCMGEDLAGEITDRLAAKLSGELLSEGAAEAAVGHLFRNLAGESLEDCVEGLRKKLEA